MSALVLVLALGACHVVLVSEYDDTFDQEITGTQRDVDALFQKAIGNTDKAKPTLTAETYSKDIEAYAKVHNDLDALLVRAKAHSKNSDTINSVNKIIHSFSLVENDMKTQSTILIQGIRDKLDIINDEFTALMKEELLKKQAGTDSSGTKS